MEILMYFLKSAACLAVLMLFYRFLLEKENMHVFKRFYLLGAVAASCLIPLITFTTYVEPVAADSMLVYHTETAPEASLVTGNSLQYFLWALYSLGVLFFGSKFFLNLRAILKKIRRNPKERTGHTTMVLLDEEIVPHTFWSYIFVNRKNYQEHSIPAEVFEHEQAHARQRHSFDILFMEWLQVVFWFNPLLYSVKHSIKLNHEFLADRAVLQKGIKTAAYQQTLLSFSSGASCSLANSINYSSIKKRFTVMKTHTTKKAIWAKSLLLLPLFAVLIYSCSTEEERQIPIEENTLENKSQEIASPEMISQYNRIARKYNSQEDPMVEIEDYDQMRRIYDRMSPEQRQAAEDLPKVEIIEIIEDNGDIIEVVEDSEGEVATPAMIAEYNKLAKRYNTTGVTEANVEDEEFQRMFYIYGIMTPGQREAAEKMPPPPPPAAAVPSPPAPPSPEEAITEWKAEGAEFYFQGKRSSAQEALELVRSGTKLQVETNESGATKTILLSLDKE